jgi:hypothetical protein
MNEFAQALKHRRRPPHFDEILFRGLDRAAAMLDFPDRPELAGQR